MEWENIVVKIGNLEIPVVPIQYTPPLRKWEYYFRLGEKYYFRNAGEKLVLTSKDKILPSKIKRGDLYEFKIDTNK